MLITSFKLLSVPILTKDNGIGDSGATSLSEALKINTTLAELYLFGKCREVVHTIPMIDKSVLCIYPNNRQHWEHWENGIG